MTAETNRIRLLVWNYNYSSWSMRAGMALRGTGAPFDEDSVNVATGPRPELARLSPSGRFPLLLHGKVLVWDSLAIGEYLADLFPRSGLLPRDVVARATDSRPPDPRTPQALLNSTSRRPEGKGRGDPLLSKAEARSWGEMRVSGGRPWTPRLAGEIEQNSRFPS